MTRRAAGVLKVKLATAIIGISSIHLLKTFINAAAYDEKTLVAIKESSGNLGQIAEARRDDAGALVMRHDVPLGDLAPAAPVGR